METSSLSVQMSKVLDATLIATKQREKLLKRWAHSSVPMHPVISNPQPDPIVMAAAVLHCVGHLALGHLSNESVTGCSNPLSLLTPEADLATATQLCSTLNESSSIQNEAADFAMVSLFILSFANLPVFA